MEWLTFLKEIGGVNIIAVLTVYFITAAMKKAIPLDKLKANIKRLLLVIVIPLSLSILVSTVFLLLERDCSILSYIKQVLINWAFSGLTHKIIQQYFSKCEKTNTEIK